MILTELWCDKMASKEYPTFQVTGTDWLQKYVDPEDEVIDFGCGLMPITRQLECKKMIGIDGWLPIVEQLRTDLEDMGHIYIWHLDLSGRLMEAANDNSIDVCLAIDLVEHFDKDDALRLIGHMERIARKRVVIFTPDGFMLQEREENSEFQRHRCGFMPYEFEIMGYDILQRIGGNHKAFLAVKEITE